MIAMSSTSLDNFYWTFSAAAQSIAAMTAFLLSGVALSFSIMDRLVDRDPTLYEVTESLKSKYHLHMSILAVLAALAISSSISFTFLNPTKGALREVVLWIAITADILSLVWGTIFVIKIVSPKKYYREAINEIKEYSLAQNERQEPTTLFFKAFLSFEKDVRDFLKEKGFYVPSTNEPRMSFSFRQMVDSLYQNEVISVELKNSLFEINKFRNLLFHGHVSHVSYEVLESLHRIKKEWKDVKESKS